MTPPIRMYIGRITARSAAQGDPTTVTFSAEGWGIWNPNALYSVSNKTIDNPRSFDVENASPAIGAPCEIWVMPEQAGWKVYLFAKTNSIPFDDCPAGAAQ